MHICSICEYQGKPNIKKFGSFLGELFLWGVVFVIFIIGFVMPFMWFFSFLMFIFAVFYSMKRFFNTPEAVCPKCNNRSMIPSDTPKGREIIAKNQNL